MNQEEALRVKMTLEQFTRDQGILTSVTRIIPTAQVATACMRLANEGQLNKLIALEEPIGLRLGAGKVRMKRVSGIVTCEISLPRAQFTPLHLAELQRGKGPVVAIGQDVLRQQVNMSLADNSTAHALIAGTTRSGKTVLMQNILLQLAQQNTPEKMQVLGIDGKYRGLLPFKDLAHLVHPVITEPDETIQALGWAVEEMHRRKMAPDEKPPNLVIVIDEIADIINRTGGANGKAASMIASLASMGAELGIHLLLVTQHPVQDVLGGSLARANLTARFVLRVIDTGASRLAAGVADAGGEKLLGHGDCILVAGGEMKRFQVALPAEADFERLERSNGRYLPLDRYAESQVDSTPAEKADPLTPEQIAWVLASGVPAIVPIAETLGIGKTKATRLQAFARAINDALTAHHCAICYDGEKDDEPS